MICVLPQQSSFTTFKCWHAPTSSAEVLPSSATSVLTTSTLFWVHPLQTLPPPIAEAFVNGSCCRNCRIKPPLLAATAYADPFIGSQIVL